eukprot:216396-Rhodomonas_salina.1
MANCTEGLLFCVLISPRRERMRGEERRIAGRCMLARYLVVHVINNEYIDRMQATQTCTLSRKQLRRRGMSADLQSGWHGAQRASSVRGRAEEGVCEASQLELGGVRKGLQVRV